MSGPKNKARAAHLASPQLSTAMPHFPSQRFPSRAQHFYAAGDGDGPDGLDPDGLGPVPEERARFRTFRLRFSASSRLFFFFTEGFS